MHCTPSAGNGKTNPGSLSSIHECSHEDMESIGEFGSAGTVAIYRIMLADCRV